MPKERKKFFDERTDESEVKARIVEKYFNAWANIVLGAAQRYGDGRIGYIDLYAGPGRYKDGSASTPLLILEKMISQARFHPAFFSFFNDGNSDHSATLRHEIENLPGIDKLKYRPEIGNGPVDVEAEKWFDKMRSMPTFTFFDPFGYKGLSLRIVNSVIKDWGCDCVFFFNYNRINPGISNDAVSEHMDALFTEERADMLRSKLHGKKPSQREALILEHMLMALQDMGGRYVLPFRFKRGIRTSHFLIFVSKAFKGFEVMKDIMAKESSTHDDGVASFAYAPAEQDTPILMGFLQPTRILKQSLLERFAGRTIRAAAVYKEYEDIELTRFLKKDYKRVLNELEAEGQIEADPPAFARPKRGGNPTFSDDTIVTFPPRKK